MDYSSLPRDQRITFRLPKDLKDRLQELADADRRTLGDYIYILLDRAVSKINQNQREHLQAAEEPGEYKLPRPIVVKRPADPIRKAQ